MTTSRFSKTSSFFHGTSFLFEQLLGSGSICRSSSGVIAPSVPSSSSQTGTGIFAAKALKGPSRWMHYHFKPCSRIDRDFGFDSHLHYKDFSHCKTAVPVIFGCHHQPSLVRLLPSTSEGSPRGWLELSDGDGVAALETVQCMCAYLYIYIYISINYWYIYICI